MAVLGTFAHAPTDTGVLVTAPHGVHDVMTAELAVAAARRLGVGHVVARGFTPGIRINVNRPTEGAGPTGPPEERTGRARAVFLRYRHWVRVAGGGGPLRLYVEVHGNARLETGGRIEVATTGLSLPEAEAARRRARALVASLRAAWPGYPELEVRVEPADPLLFRASRSKLEGLLADPAVRRALHVELPRAARTPALLEPTAGLLAGLVAATVWGEEDPGARASPRPPGPGPGRLSGPGSRRGGPPAARPAGRTTPSPGRPPAGP